MSDQLESMSEIEVLRNLPGLMAQELADHARQLAEKDTEIERLRGALREISQHDSDEPKHEVYVDIPESRVKWFKLGWVKGRKQLAQIARKALAEKG